MIEQEIAGRTAWFAHPNGSPRGAVVVCHGGAGLGPHERGVIERLAGLGYAAVAPDLYGVKPSVEMIKALVAAPGLIRERVGTAIDHVRSHGQVAVIGYCFGGTAALEAARAGFDLACVVSFHGGLVAVDPATAIKTRVLACAGGADPHCPPDKRAAFEAEMTQAGADWQLHVYGGALHAFTMHGSEKIPGCAYHERADRRSWAAMLELFDETIQP